MVLNTKKIYLQRNTVSVSYTHLDVYKRQHIKYFTQFTLSVKFAEIKNNLHGNDS